MDIFHTVEMLLDSDAFGFFLSLFLCVMAMVYWLLFGVSLPPFVYAMPTRIHRHLVQPARGILYTGTPDIPGSFPGTVTATVTNTTPAVVYDAIVRAPVPSKSCSALQKKPSSDNPPAPVLPTSSQPTAPPSPRVYLEPPPVEFLKPAITNPLEIALNKAIRDLAHCHVDMRKMTKDLAELRAESRDERDSRIIELEKDGAGLEQKFELAIVMARQSEKNMKDERNRHKLEKKELNERLEVVAQRIGELEAEIRRANETEQADSRIVELEVDIEELQKKLTAFNSERDGHNKALEALKEELRVSQKETVDAKAGVRPAPPSTPPPEPSNVALQFLEAQLAAVKGELEVSRTDSARFRRHARQWEEETRKWGTLYNQADAKVKALLPKVDTLQRELTTACTERDFYKNDKANVNKLNSQLIAVCSERDSYKNRDGTIEQLQGCLREITNERNYYKDEHGQIAELQSRLAAMTHERDLYKNSNAQGNEGVNQLLTEREHTNIQNRALRNENIAGHTALAGANSRIESLEGVIRDGEAQAGQMAKQIQSLQREVQRFHASAGPTATRSIQDLNVIAELRAQLAARPDSHANMVPTSVVAGKDIEILRLRGELKIATMEKMPRSAEDVEKDTKQARIEAAKAEGWRQKYYKQEEEMRRLRNIAEDAKSSKNFMHMSRHRAFVDELRARHAAELDAKAEELRQRNIELQLTQDQKAALEMRPAYQSSRANKGRDMEEDSDDSVVTTPDANGMTDGLRQPSTAGWEHARPRRIASPVKRLRKQEDALDDLFEGPEDPEQKRAYEAAERELERKL